MVSSNDDKQFFDRAKSSIISDIISTQSVEVDAVSGATFSSNGILEAVANALELSYTNPNSESPRGNKHHGEDPNEDFPGERPGKGHENMGKKIWQQFIIIIEMAAETM